MVGVLHSLNSLASGKHDITYGIVCDVDDPETISTCQVLRSKMPVAFSVNERGPSLGGMVNDMADNVPADVYLSLADDVLCMTKDWDDVIAKATEEIPHGVFWWKPANDKQPVLYAIVTEKWRAAAGQIFTDHFPYWYDDVWLLTVWCLVTEGPMITLPITILDCPKATHRMRELRFWHSFYLGTECLRVKQAKDIQNALGLHPSREYGEQHGQPNLSITERLSEHLSTTPQEFLDTMEQIEAQQGEKGPPTPEYLRARDRAQALLNQISIMRACLPHMKALEGLGVAA